MLFGNWRLGQRHALFHFHLLGAQRFQVGHLRHLGLERLLQRLVLRVLALEFDVLVAPVELLQPSTSTITAASAENSRRRGRPGLRLVQVQAAELRGDVLQGNIRIERHDQTFPAAGLAAASDAAPFFLSPGTSGAR